MAILNLINGRISGMDRDYFEIYKQWIETIEGDCNEKNHITVDDDADYEHFFLKRFTYT